MIIIYIFLGFITLMVIAYAIYNMFRAEELDAREQDLDKYSVHLDERANKLAEWEQELIKWDKEEKQ